MNLQEAKANATMQPIRVTAPIYALIDIRETALDENMLAWKIKTTKRIKALHE